MSLKRIAYEVCTSVCGLVVLVPGFKPAVLKAGCQTKMLRRFALELVACHLGHAVIEKRCTTLC